MYEVINKELGIKACGLGDLTAEQMSHFLGQWEEGATIGTLTLFFEDETGDVVLNKDNELYESYLSLAEEYLSASVEVRKLIREVCPIPGLKETLDVLERCLQTRAINKIIFFVERAPIPDDASREVLQAIFNSGCQSHLVLGVLNAYNYGVIQGKRLERAKRKGM